MRTASRGSSWQQPFRGQWQWPSMGSTNPRDRLGRGGGQSHRGQQRGGTHQKGAHHYGKTISESKPHEKRRGEEEGGVEKGSVAQGSVYNLGVIKCLFVVGLWESERGGRHARRQRRCVPRLSELLHNRRELTDHHHHGNALLVKAKVLLGFLTTWVKEGSAMGALIIKVN